MALSKPTGLSPDEVEGIPANPGRGRAQPGSVGPMTGTSSISATVKTS